MKTYFKHPLSGYSFLVIVAALLTLVVYSARVSGDSDSKTTQSSSQASATAIFAGGCFWCIEEYFEKVPGVTQAVSGYIGGNTPNPTYAEVSSGKSGHIEAVKVYYDSNQVSYTELLNYFWRQIDPTDNKGQFVDRGSQYRPALFIQNDAQREVALDAIAALDASGFYTAPVSIELLPETTFYPAESYHQDYYIESPIRYQYYKKNSGRPQYLEAQWGDQLYYDHRATSGPSAADPFVQQYSQFVRPSPEALRSQLTSLEYHVTQEEGTERAFNNRYWNNKAAGIYVDIVSGEPLFSSTHKYDSGTGWPSFTQPLFDEFIVTREDSKLFYTRIELRSRFADSHLGHVFDDGPAPTGLRYCINSAALRFVPTDQMAEQGYGALLSLFEP